MDGTNDNLELEVSDLRTGRTLETPLTRQRPAEPAAGSRAAQTSQGEQGPGDADLTVEPIAGGRAAVAPAVLASRRARGFAVAGLVAFVCAAILLTLPGPRLSLQQALAGPTPTPTATLAPGAQVVYFQQSVPWGKLTVDGNQIWGTQPGQGAALDRGRHTLDYQAAPFKPVHCQISVPARGDDTCPIDGHVTYDNLAAARVVDLGTTPDHLPNAQRASLMAAIAAAYAKAPQTATVEPGDHYLDASGAPATAFTPMRATLTYALNTDAQRVNSLGLGSDCVSLCEFGDQGWADWWVVSAHVIARWQFAAPDGSVTHPNASADLDAALQVGARWADAWSVTLQPNPGNTGQLCWPVFQQAFAGGNPLMNGGGGTITNGDTSDADGCVEVVTSASDTGGISGGPYVTPTPLPPDAAVYIYRFGVVLAGSDAAHAAQPQLPVATPHERALAQQWLARQG